MWVRVVSIAQFSPVVGSVQSSMHAKFQFVGLNGINLMGNIETSLYIRICVGITAFCLCIHRVKFIINVPSTHFL